MILHPGVLALLVSALLIALMALYAGGYLLYIAILTAAVSGFGVGLLQRYRRVPSLSEAVPAFQRRLTVTALWSLGVLAFLTAIPVVTTSFTLR